MPDKTFIRITNQDIYAKIEELVEHQKEANHATAKAIERIGTLENKSIGIWISKNPFKFTILCIILMSLIISDIRHPLLELLTNFI